MRVRKWELVASFGVRGVVLACVSGERGGAPQSGLVDDQPCSRRCGEWKASGRRVSDATGDRRGVAWQCGVGSRVSPRLNYPSGRARLSLLA